MFNTVSIKSVREAFARNIKRCLYNEAIVLYYVELANEIDGLLDFSDAYIEENIESLCDKILNRKMNEIYLQSVLLCILQREMYSPLFYEKTSRQVRGMQVLQSYRTD